jgi:hypothetical protein
VQNAKVPKTELWARSNPSETLGRTHEPS